MAADVEPVVGVAPVWLIFALTVLRDASFADAWRHALVMVVIGAVHLAGLYLRRESAGLAMPEKGSIDAELDDRAGAELR